MNIINERKIYREIEINPVSKCIGCGNYTSSRITKIVKKYRCICNNNK